MSYLQQYLDPALRVREEETAAQIAGAEVERLNRLYAVAMAARKVPRRLGKDAADEELARDIRSSRRVAHVAEQSLKAWGSEPKLTTDVSRDAAQVRWMHWLDEHRVYLFNRMKYIATWQYRTGSDPSWAKGAVVRLESELRWLEYALRDCP